MGLLSKIALTVFGTSILWMPALETSIYNARGETRAVVLKNKPNKPIYFVYKMNDGSSTHIYSYGSNGAIGRTIVDTNSDGHADVYRTWAAFPRKGIIKTENPCTPDQLQIFEDVVSQWDSAKRMTGFFKPFESTIRDDN